VGEASFIASLAPRGNAMPRKPNESPTTDDPSKYRVPIIVALIALFGTVAGALFSNWDKVFRPDPPAPANVVVAPVTAAPSISPTVSDAVFVEPVTDRSEPSITPRNAVPVREKKTEQKITSTNTASSRRVRRSGNVEEETTLETTVVTTRIVTVTTSERVVSIHHHAHSGSHHPVKSFPDKMAVIVEGKEFVLDQSERPDDESLWGKFEFPAIPCNKKKQKIIIRATFPAKLIENDKVKSKTAEKKFMIDCRNPKIDINFDEIAAHAK